MKKEFRVVIAGSRNFKDYELLTIEADYMLSNKIKEGYEIVVVSGRARGTDSLGERYAEEKGYRIDKYPADWNNLDVQPCKIKYNKFNKPYNALAGHNRNEQMAKHALEVNGGCLLFHDGTSTGTKNMIDLCIKLKLNHHVILY